jgi:hypothetical protein
LFGINRYNNALASKFCANSLLTWDFYADELIETLSAPFCSNTSTSATEEIPHQQ